jgi:proteic killer suppression protein
MIRNFKHKGIEKFFNTGSKAGIRSAHAPKLARQLIRLDLAKTAADMNVPGWKLHPLKGKLTGHWAVTVSGNWRLIFEFIESDAFNIDYDDYH